MGKQRKRSIEEEALLTPSLTADDINLIDDLKTPDYNAERIKQRYPHLRLAPEPNDGLTTTEVLDQALEKLGEEIGINKVVDTSIFQTPYRGAPEYAEAQNLAGSHLSLAMPMTAFSTAHFSPNEECLEVGTFSPTAYIEGVAKGVEKASQLALDFAEVYDADSAQMFGWQTTKDKLVIGISLIANRSPS